VKRRRERGPKQLNDRAVLSPDHDEEGRITFAASSRDNAPTLRIEQGEQGGTGGSCGGARSGVYSVGGERVGEMRRRLVFW